jgi:DHA1 family tetracycline resistance protein-like MFS transporter
LRSDSTSSLRLLLTVQFSQHFKSGIISPILALFIRRQGMTVTQIGLLGTASMLGWLIFEPLSGVVADRVRKKYMVAFAIVASSVIYFLYPLASSIWHFAALAFTMSSVMAPYAISVKALAAELIPPSSRGRTYGWYMSAVSVGGILGPIIGGYLSGAVGYSVPFYIAAGVGVVGLAGVLLMKYDDRSDKVMADKENHADGRLWTRAFYTILLIRMLYLINMVFRSNFLPIYLNESPAIAASEAEIGLYLGGLQVMSALSQPFLGGVTDKLGSRAVITSSLGMAGLSYVGLTLLRGIFPLYLLGLAQGAFFAAADLSMMVHLMDVMHEGRTGMVMGLYSESENVGGMIASPSLGLIYDGFGPSQSTLSVAAVLLLNAALSAVLLRRPSEFG